MADAQRVVELIFQGVDKTGAATQAALQNAQTFTKSLEAATQPIADFTVGALKLEAALLTAGAAVALFSVKVAGDFDSAFREISTLIEQPVEELEKFRRAILDYAATSSKPLADITDAIYNAISAGVDYADSIEAIALAEKLAIAGKAGLNESLLVVVQSLNAYGLGMEEAERFADALFATVDQGVTTLPQLAESLGGVTNAAATLEIPFETLLAAIATLTAGGASTSDAVTRINAALSNLIKPSAEAEKAAKALEIEFGAQAVKAKGLEAVLLEVATATGGNEQEMAKFFGSIQAVKAVFPLVGVQADSFAERLDALRNSSGAVAAAFDKMAGDIGLSNQRVKTSLQLLFIEIGAPLLDEYGGIADAVAAIFNAIGANVSKGKLGELVKVVEDIFKDVQGTLEKIAKNLPEALEKADFSGFSDGLQVVVDAVKALFGNIDLSTVDGLKKAIELLGAGFLGLSQFTANVIEVFKPLFELIVSGVEWVGKLDKETFGLLGSLGGLALAINTLIPLLNTLLLGLIAVSSAKGAAGAAGAAGALSAAILGPAGLVAAVVAGGAAFGVWLANTQAAKEQTEQLGVTFNGFGDGIDNIAGAVQKVARGAFVDYLDASGKVIASTIASEEAFDEWSKGITRVTRGPFTDYIDKMGNVVKTTTESGESLAEWNARLLASGETLEQSQAGIDKFGKSISESSLIIDTSTGRVTGYRGAWEKLTEAQQNAVFAGKEVGKELPKLAPPLQSIAEKTEEAAAAARKWNEEVQKMQHLERLKLIEAQTAITTAQIQADAQKMVAAFESVSVGIQSTGETLLGFYGILASNNLGIREQLNLEREIEKESKRRDQEFELQKKLIEQQIAEIKARTEAMQRGDAMIQIDGAGLQPHLEAFMWEILRSIQTRVNADGYEMLLGA